HDDNGPRDAKLGRVLFKTSCSPQAQKEFEIALARLHSFHFPETVKGFGAIPQTDPTCAIAYWGLAVSTRPNPLVGPWDAATLKYAKIAPAAPHAVHMPSHIYSMVGMWKESIDSNAKSNVVSKKYSEEAKLDGVLAGVPHALDFMQYAYLQLGQDAKAKAL